MLAYRTDQPDVESVLRVIRDEPIQDVDDSLPKNPDFLSTVELISPDEPVADLDADVRFLPVVQVLKELIQRGLNLLWGEPSERLSDNHQFL